MKATFAALPGGRVVGAALLGEPILADVPDVDVRLFSFEQPAKNHRSEPEGACPQDELQHLLFHATALRQVACRGKATDFRA